MTELSSERYPWKGFTSRLRDYVRRRVAPAEADDVLGDILLRLVYHSKELAAADNAAAWIYRVAANAIVDHHRRRSTEARVLSRAGPSYNEPATERDLEHSVSADLAKCITPLVRSLPEPYREALLLTEIGGLSQIEASRRLGISSSGMKSRVQRGRMKLKAALLGCCEVELDRRNAVLDYKPRSSDCPTACGSDNADQRGGTTVSD
jgi:RNA polymerase sigma-70 factor (ECF subfamily)